jgi:hypothetical protein
MTVLACGDLGPTRIGNILHRFGLAIVAIAPGKPIPGSYWGEPEAGLVDNRLYVRADTPVHSALHEACHWICMDDRRRKTLHTDAGGDVAEESAVCYLQVLLADEIPGVGRERLFLDMDAWQYSFRLGSTRAWFDRDAEDARTWLLQQGLIDDRTRTTWRVRS